METDFELATGGKRDNQVDIQREKRRLDLEVKVVHMGKETRREKWIRENL